MLTLSEGVKDLVQERTHRLTTCWEVARRDGVILRFTDHDSKLTVLGQSYTPAGGFSSSARQWQGDLRASRMDFQGVISSPAITTEDLRQGRYRGATVTERLVDWKYPFAGAILTNVYRVLEVRFTGEHWEAEVSGLFSRLGQPVGDVFGRTCRHELGDTGCKVALGPFTATGASVSSAVDRRTFTATDTEFASKAANFYALGKVTWTSGANVSLKGEVRSSTAASGNSITFELQLAMPSTIAASDVFDVVAGCDKLLATCRAKFDNVVNFGGFPFIPGADKSFESPDR